VLALALTRSFLLKQFLRFPSVTAASDKKIINNIDSNKKPIDLEILKLFTSASMSYHESEKGSSNKVR
jgi:hypothetical protein